MTDLGLVTADRIRVAEGFPTVQRTLPAEVAIDAGQAVRLATSGDTTAGRFTLANGTDAAEANVWGIALHTVAVGEPVTAVRMGLLDGYDLDALDFGDPVYLSDTDGTLTDDAADATVDVIVGRVEPGTQVTLGTAYDKLLRVELSGV